VRTAHKDLDIGYEIEPLSYHITQEKINTYSRYAFYGKDTKNIHTDDEVADAGLPAPWRRGAIPCLLSERMLEFLGRAD
jgi:hypothetical protein